MNPENVETVSIKLASFHQGEQGPKYRSLHKGENLTEIQYYICFLTYHN